MLKLLDSSALVALLDKGDPHHEWAKGLVLPSPRPMITCEAVISESMFLLPGPRGHELLWSMLTRGAVAVTFHLDENTKQVSTLMKKYANVPMSFADACLVRMSELAPHATLLTLDSDFKIYRRFGREQIPARYPA